MEPQNSQQKRFYEFGPFTLDTEQRVLFRDGQPLDLPPKLFDTLLALIEQSGQIVEKNQLMEQVWPDSFVDESNLASNVSLLRKALGNGEDGRPYIQTVPKRGYRFIAVVNERLADDVDLVMHRRTRARFITHDQDEVPALDEGSPVPLLPASETAAISIRGARRSYFPSRRGVAVIVFIAVIVLAIAFFWRRSRPALGSAIPEVKSLAVLPLQNLSGDSAQDYFAEGMTEELIANLSKISSLRVISRTSVMQYRGASKPLKEIAQELNVDAVIEGSVQRLGNHVRINARLIYAATEEQIWADTYEREEPDVMSLELAVAQAVADKIRVNLSPAQRILVARTHTVIPVAYDYYLRGKFHIARHNKIDNDAAIKNLEQAVASDANFAPAYAELARAYTKRSFFFTPDEKQWEEKAFVAVMQALALDPDSADAYFARGFSQWTPSNRFPHEKAIQDYQHALTLNPNLAEAHAELATVLNHVGLLDKSLDEAQKAVDLDPSDPQLRAVMAQTLLYRGDSQKALDVFSKLPEGTAVLTEYHIAWALLSLGRREEASIRIAELLKKDSADVDGRLSSIQALLAAAAGDKTKAEKEIRAAQERRKAFGHFHHTAYTIACAFAMINQQERAMQWLQIAADDGFPSYELFLRDPNLVGLHSNPQFIAFMAKLKQQMEGYSGTP